MIANTLSEMCKAMAPALGNHLWQSTAFAFGAGLLALVLRNNHARGRYVLWLTASLKFLVPYSLLAGVGSHIAWWRSSAAANAGLYIAIDQLSQPFSHSRLSLISEASPPIHSTSLIDLLPALLAVVWFCGMAVVVLAWYMRWRRVSAVMRKAAPLREGREVDALRCLERTAGISNQIELRVSQTALEPGIFGIVRPILVWPHGISERLENEHLAAILEHELCHARRRDNLSATLHMAVEAIFWFHPIVWWLGAKLLQERERACDEQVLEFGSDRQVYAESILKICEFCVGSPLDFVSGVTGFDLKNRIVNIMANNVGRKLDFSRKLLLSAAGFAAVAFPVAFGLFNATQSRANSQEQIAGVIPPVYEAVSIKAISIRPNESAKHSAGIGFTIGDFSATDVTVQTLIKAAYNVEDSQISGAPSWLNSETFDIEAKWDKSIVEALKELSQDQLALERGHMLRELLSDRFKLTLHREFQHLPVYYLVIAQKGPKLHKAKPGDTYPKGIRDMDGKGHGGLMSLREGQLTGQGVPVASLVRQLLREVSREFGGSIIEDKTGLTGNYDFTLHWTPGEGQPALFRSLQEQLGLRLEPQNGPAEFLVIDHVEKPAGQVVPDTATATYSFQSVSVKPNTTDTPMAGFSIQDKNFSAAMFKPDRFMANNVMLHQLIRLAYGVQDSQIVSGLDWLNSEKFDVDAKIGSSVAEELKGLGENEANSERLHMMQLLLAVQFKLTLHRETKELPVYVLAVAADGPKLQTAKPGDTYGKGVKGMGGAPAGPGEWQSEKGKIVFQGRPLSSLAQYLSDRLGRIVLDKTELTGNYDFALQWTPTSPESSSPSILEAVQEQLGLKLEQQNTATEVLVIDRAEKPSDN
jgi:bla regulator protein BlaR1